MQMLVWSAVQSSSISIKNTVKYRIKKISELIGTDITVYSEFYDAYMACMLYRLIND
ncbi:helix-turn-helix domain-containing protein [Lysinibacillus boronitolerans]|uniref:helix-turn-helix domain-containing protein n=1 Tax=Lysinibacillus boronitolerans TaxID=309788 RepID=UPI003B75C2C4